MIILDSSELSSNSTMPTIEGAKSSPVLESVTGADVMITTLGIPATTERLIHKHIENGAILAQIKRGTDLLSSIADERINIALARMHQCGTRYAWQRLIISTCILIPDLATGEVLVGVPRQSPSSNETYLYLRRGNEGLPGYKSVATIRWRIAARGGYFLPLTCDDELVPTLLQIENDLKWMKGKPVKDIFPPFERMTDEPDEDDPLQLPVVVEDGRRIIAAFDGVGKVKATALWDAIREFNRKDMYRDHPEPTLSQALFWASCENPKDFGIPKVKGWGKGLRAKVREQMGLEPGFNLRSMADNWGEIG